MDDKRIDDSDKSSAQRDFYKRLEKKLGDKFLNIKEIVKEYCENNKKLDKYVELKSLSNSFDEMSVASLLEQVNGEMEYALSKVGKLGVKLPSLYLDSYDKNELTTEFVLLKLKTIVDSFNRFYKGNIDLEKMCKYYFGQAFRFDGEKVSSETSFITPSAEYAKIRDDLAEKRDYVESMSNDIVDIVNKNKLAIKKVKDSVFREPSEQYKTLRDEYSQCMSEINRILTLCNDKVISFQSRLAGFHPITPVGKCCGCEYDKRTKRWRKNGKFVSRH